MNRAAHNQRSRRSMDRRGMTILEVMIAMLIVLGMTMSAVVLINSITRASLKAESMRLSGYIKNTFAMAAIHQQYYRLMLDLDTQEFWIEVAEQTQIGAPPQIPEQSIIGAPEGVTAPGQAPKGGYDSDDPEAQAFGVHRPTYKPVEGMLNKRRKLDGISLHSIVTANETQPRETGRLGITFYPNGFAERSLIILGDEDTGFMTLEIQPLSGKVQLWSGKQEADSDFFDVEDDD